MKSNSSPKIYGLLADFKSPKGLLDAAKAVRQAGYKKYDAHSPFPIHGMEKAMNLSDSKLGWIVALFACIGFLAAISLQVWAMSLGYPFIISGKPLKSFEAFVPITFELTILLSAFAATFGMIALNKLPMWSHPLFKNPRFNNASSHAFFIVIEATDSHYHLHNTKQFLQSIGATHVEEINF